MAGAQAGQRMAELHGGAVEVKSTPGTGTRFVVTLPWQQGAPEDMDDEAQPAFGPGKRLLHPPQPRSNKKPDAAGLLRTGGCVGFT